MSFQGLHGWSGFSGSSSGPIYSPFGFGGSSGFSGPSSGVSGTVYIDLPKTEFYDVYTNDFCLYNFKRTGPPKIERSRREIRVIIIKSPGSIIADNMELPIRWLQRYHRGLIERLNEELNAS